MGAGRILSNAATTASSGSPASMCRIGVATAPRPTAPTAWASVSRSVIGSGCSRADQRGRCHTNARDALSASTPAPGGRSARTCSSSRRSRGAAVENNESASAAYGLPSGLRRPIRLGRPGRSSHAESSRCHLTAVGDSRNRSVATVGAQYGPAGSGGSGSGSPGASSPAPAVISNSNPSRSSSMPVVLARRLTSRTPRPPLRSSGIGVALSVSSTISASRSRSMAAPAATASTSAAVVDDTVGSGRVVVTGPGASPRRTCPTRRGRITVSVSRRRSNPADNRRCTGRSAGASGAASRVRPTGEPSTRRSSSSRESESRLSSAAARSASGMALSTVAWPGYHGRLEATSAATRSAPFPEVSPHTSARASRFSRAWVTEGPSARSPNAAVRSAVVTAVVSACRVSSASSTDRCRKSRSSVAALID